MSCEFGLYATRIWKLNSLVNNKKRMVQKSYICYNSTHAPSDRSVVITILPYYFI